MWHARWVSHFLRSRQGSAKSYAALSCSSSPTPWRRPLELGGANHDAPCDLARSRLGRLARPRQRVEPFLFQLHAAVARVGPPVSAQPSVAAGGGASADGGTSQRAGTPVL